MMTGVQSSLCFGTDSEKSNLQSMCVKIMNPRILSCVE